MISYLTQYLISKIPICFDIIHSIPVIGCTAIGIRSKTIEIIKNNFSAIVFCTLTILFEFRYPANAQMDLGSK